MVRNLVFAACWILAACISTAQACSSVDPPQSREVLFARASSVFSTHLLRTEEVRTVIAHRSELVVEAAFRTIEIFKGQPPADGKVRSPVYGPGNCSVPLLAGSDYLFFLYDGNLILTLPGGTEMFWNVEGADSGDRAKIALSASRAQLHMMHFGGVETNS